MERGAGRVVNENSSGLVKARRLKNTLGRPGTKTEAAFDRHEEALKVRGGERKDKSKLKTGKDSCCSPSGTSTRKTS